MTIRSQALSFVLYASVDDRWMTEQHFFFVSHAKIGGVIQGQILTFFSIANSNAPDAKISLSSSRHHTPFERRWNWVVTVGNCSIRLTCYIVFFYKSDPPLQLYIIYKMSDTISVLTYIIPVVTFHSKLIMFYNNVKKHYDICLNRLTF